VKNKDYYERFPVVNEGSLSFVILSKNNGETLDRCLSSVFELNPGEVVIVDAHSTDRTMEILEKYRNKIKLLFDEGMGISIARNIGWMNARSDIIAFLDADAYINKDDFLSRVKKHFEDKELGVLVCYPKTVKSNIITEIISGIIEAEREEMRSNKNVIVGGPCFLVPRRCLAEVNGFDDRHIFGADDLCVIRRILLRGYRLEVLYDSSVHHYPRSSVKGLFKERYGWGKGYSIYAKEFPERNRFKQMVYILFKVPTFAPIIGTRLAIKLRKPLYLPIYTLIVFAWSIGCFVGFLTWARDVKPYSKN